MKSYPFLLKQIHGNKANFKLGKQTELVKSREKQINKLLAVPVPKVLANLTQHYAPSTIENFVYLPEPKPKVTPKQTKNNSQQMKN